MKKSPTFHQYASYNGPATLHSLPFTILSNHSHGPTLQTPKNSTGDLGAKKNKWLSS